MLTFTSFLAALLAAFAKMSTSIGSAELFALHRNQAPRLDAKQPRALLGVCETTVAGLSAHQVESVGEVQSCAPAQSSAKKLRIRLVFRASGEMECMPIENEAREVQQPHVVAVGRGPTKLELEHHVASGHAQHRTWCDACTKACGMAGRQEKRGSGRDDEDPLMAMDYVYRHSPVARTFFCAQRAHYVLRTSSCVCTYTHGSRLPTRCLHMCHTSLSSFLPSHVSPVPAVL